VGVCAYQLLFGEPPFPGNSVEETMPLIMENNPKHLRVVDAAIESVSMPAASEEAKAFIRKCLTSDPNLRPSAEVALMDDWFSTVVRVDGGKGLSIVRIHDFGADPQALSNLSGMIKLTTLPQVTMLPQNLSARLRSADFALKYSYTPCLLGT
jgi:serine/threonine protein kinase